MWWLDLGIWSYSRKPLVNFPRSVYRWIYQCRCICKLRILCSLLHGRRSCVDWSLCKRRTWNVFCWRIRTDSCKFFFERMAHFNQRKFVEARSSRGPSFVSQQFIVLCCSPKYSAKRRIGNFGWTLYLLLWWWRICDEIPRTMHCLHSISWS